MNLETFTYRVKYPWRVRLFLWRRRRRRARMRRTDPELYAAITAFDRQFNRKFWASVLGKDDES